MHLHGFYLIKHIKGVLQIYVKWPYLFIVRMREAIIGPAQGLFDWLPVCVDSIGQELINNARSDWASCSVSVDSTMGVPVTAFAIIEI